MGSAEGTMSVFAKSDLLTLFGRVEKWTETKEEQKYPRHYAEKLKSTIGEATRDNLQYLKGRANILVYKALKALSGF